MQRRLAAIGVVVVLLLGACGGKPPATPHKSAVAPEPGQCVANQRADLDDIAPDFTSVVSCGVAHTYEIVNVLPVPDRFLKGTAAKERLQNRTALAKVASVDDGDLQHAFRAYALERCRLSIVGATGLQSLKIRGRTAAAAHVYPLLGGAELRLNLTPAPQWARGDRDFVCSIRYTAHQNGRENRAVDRIRSRTALPAYRTLMTGSFPADRRQCVTYTDNGDGDRILISCTKQHYGEMLFRYDASKVFGHTFIAGIEKRWYDNQDLTDKQLEALDKPCFDSMDELFGPSWSDELTAVSEPGDTGWEADLHESAYDVNCIAIPYESETYDLPPGSLFNGAQTVHLVKIGKRLNS